MQYKEKISARTLCRYSRLLTTAERKDSLLWSHFNGAHPSLRNFITETELWNVRYSSFKFQPNTFPSLLYCITTTKAFDDMPPLCASAAVLALCHFNGALCQFGSYGWHWLYNALCVIFQNCLIFKHQTALKMSTLKHAKKDFCP